MSSRIRQSSVLVVLLFFHTINTYMDRVCISAAKNDVAAELHISDQFMGYIFGAFALGYALFQIPAGWFVDTYGPKKSLAIIVTLWAFFTMITGAAYSFVALFVIRLLFGAAEAGAFPGATRALYNWLPVQDRSVAQGIFHSGARIGAAASLFIIPFLIQSFGWRMTFVICGVVGIVWVIVWLVWFKDNPEDHPKVSPAELAYIRKGMTNDFVSTESIPLGQMLTSSNVLLLMLQGFTTNFTVFITYTWLLPYLANEWGQQNEIYAAVPPVLGAVALWTSGPFIRFLYKKGMHVESRKIPAIGGIGLACVALLLLTQVTSVIPFILLFGIALFGVEFGTNASWTTAMDIGGSRSGSISAAMNMANNLGAAVCSVAFPFFMHNVTIPFFAPEIGTANAYFVFAAVLNLVAVLAWVFINPKRKIGTLSASQIRVRVATLVVSVVLFVALMVYLNL